MRTSRQNSAFTLFELLVILIVIAFLVCALLPVLARTNQDTNAVQCLNNFRQLMNGWKMYSDDYQGKLARNCDCTPNWIKGLLDFSSSPDNTNVNNLVGSSALLGVYVRSASFFKCPADKSMVRNSSTWMPRVRSISMNAYVGEGSHGWNTSYRQYEKSIDIVSPTPANLWILIDEHEDSINDGAFYTAPTASSTSDTIVDFPASRHNRAGTISFADGRAEIHVWRDARTMPRPTYTGSLSLNVFSPNNVDMDWLNQRSSSPP